MATNTFIDLQDILGGYSKEIDDLSYEIAKEIAKEGVKEIKNASPVNVMNTQRKGSYKKGWRMDIEKGFGTVEAIIHNATDYQLTHLLERPHLKRNQFGSYGTTYPKSEGHISKVQDEVSREFENELVRRIKGL